VANVVQIAINARNAAAAAMANAGRQLNNLGQQVGQLSRRFALHRYQVQMVNGAYRDANGRFRDAQGRFISQAAAMQIVITRWGRFANAVESATRALLIYSGVSRLASLADSDKIKAFAGSFALLASKIVGVIAVALPLIGIIGNIIPAVMLVAPAAVTAGLGLVALKLAFNGVGEALQAGLSGDAEAFTKALQKLAPSAADTVKVLVGLRREWAGVAKDFQGRVFEGAAGEVASLSRFIRPIVEKWLPILGLKIAGIRNALANGLANFSADGRLEAVFRNVHMAISSILDVVPPLARAFGDILEVAAPRFSKLTDDGRGLAVAFADWIRAAKDSGKLGQWLDKAIETLGQIKEIAGNVGEILKGIFTSNSGNGDDMLQQLVDTTQAMADFANSGNGQTILTWAGALLGVFGQFAPIFQAWAFWFSGMVEAVKAGWAGLLAVVRAGVSSWLGYLEALLWGATKAFGWIPGIGDKLRSALKEFQQFKDGVNAALDGIQDEVVNITYRSRVIGDMRLSGAQLSGEYSSGIGGRASGGNASGLRWVGERGRELVDFGANRVYNNNQSRNMTGTGPVGPAGGGPGWSGGMVVQVEAAPGNGSSWLAQGFLAALHSGQLRLKAAGGNGRVKPA
jgi:hypothetical protein